MQRGYNFVPFFPLTKKLEVNGKNSHPIFNHLKVSLIILRLHIFFFFSIFFYFQRVCDPPWEEFWPSEKNLWEPKHSSDVRWNFEKWLIDKDGIIFYFYFTI